MSAEAGKPASAAWPEANGVARLRAIAERVGSRYADRARYELGFLNLLGGRKQHTLHLSRIPKGWFDSKKGRSQAHEESHRKQSKTIEDCILSVMPPPSKQHFSLQFVQTLGHVATLAAALIVESQELS
jgi:hypothetical protein